MTHLSTDGYLDCFHFSTKAKNAAMNTGCKYIFKTLFSIPLNLYPGIGLLDHMFFYFNFFRNCRSILHSSCTILHSYLSAQECHLLHIETKTCYFMFFGFLNSKCPDGCEVVSRGFDLHFPNDDWIQGPFHMSVSHLDLFRELPNWILCPILNRVLWVLCHRNSIYHTLNISPLLNTWFAKVFSHSIGCLSTVWIVSWSLWVL